MEKYVYQINKYINIQKMKREILPLINNDNSLNTMYNKTLEYLDIDTSLLKNPKVCIEIIDDKKSICDYLKSYYISDLKNKLEYNKMIDLLNEKGINSKVVNVNSLLLLIKFVLDNEEIVKKLNLMNSYNYCDMSNLLKSYNIIVSKNIIEYFINLLNQISVYNLTNTICCYQPIERIKYYDENNHNFSKIIMNPDYTIFSPIVKFEGEIHEYTNFKNEEEARNYQKKYNIEEDLLDDVISYIHFTSDSTIKDWYNDLTIIKYKVGCIYINYGERLFVQNKKNNVSINPEEIDAIINEFKYRDIDNEFIKYVINELEKFKKTLIGKMDEYNVDNGNMLNQIICKRNNSLMEAQKILLTSNYGNYKTINVKIKVISDTPVCFNKNKSLVLK